jgi:acyl dehydratase
MVKYSTMPRTVSVEELQSLIGREIAASSWTDVTQAMIDRFADATGDHQWIHVDPARARAETPFGGAIAHGFLTLALLSELSRDALDVTGDFKMRINYGLNRLRFVSPVPAGSRIRARFTLAAIERIEGGWQTVWNVVVEIEGGAKPALVAEWLTRAYE